MLPAAAQQTIHSASVSGRIKDPSGAAVEGARVVAIHLETKLSNSVDSDSEGRYRFPYLKAGRYQISVRKHGFNLVSPFYSCVSGPRKRGQRPSRPLLRTSFYWLLCQQVQLRYYPPHYAPNFDLANPAVCLLSFRKRA